MSLWNKVRYYFRQFLRKLGLKLDFSDAEINYILGISEDNYKGPKKGENLKEYAKRIAERNTGTRYSGKSNRQNKRNILQSAPISLILPAEVELAGVDYTNLSRSIYNTIADARLQKGETMTGYAYSGNYFCVFTASGYDSARIMQLLDTIKDKELINKITNKYDRYFRHNNQNTDISGSRERVGGSSVLVHHPRPYRGGIFSGTVSAKRGTSTGSPKQVNERSTWDGSPIVERQRQQSEQLDDSPIRYRQKENKKDVLPLDTWTVPERNEGESLRDWAARVNQAYLDAREAKQVASYNKHMQKERKKRKAIFTCRYGRAPLAFNGRTSECVPTDHKSLIAFS